MIAWALIGLGVWLLGGMTVVLFVAGGTHKRTPRPRPRLRLIRGEKENNENNE